MLHAWSEYIVYGYSAYSVYTCAAAVRPAVHIYITTAVYNIHVYTHPSAGERSDDRAV